MSAENFLTGDWQGALKRMGALADKVVENCKIATQQNAQVMLKTIRLHMEKQDLGWEALKPAYKRWKARNKRSTLTWFSTSETYKSLTIVTDKDGLGAFVGVTRRSKRKDRKPGVMVAAVQEYGSAARGIPARPLFRPSFKEKLQEMKDRYRRAVAAALRSK